jgi:hypothetical protein
MEAQPNCPCKRASKRVLSAGKPRFCDIFTPQGWKALGAIPLDVTKSIPGLFH